MLKKTILLGALFIISTLPGCTYENHGTEKFSENPKYQVSHNTSSGNNNIVEKKQKNTLNPDFINDNMNESEYEQQKEKTIINIGETAEKYTLQTKKNQLDQEEIDKKTQQLQSEDEQSLSDTKKKQEKKLQNLIKDKEAEMKKSNHSEDENEEK